MCPRATRAISLLAAAALASGVGMRLAAHEEPSEPAFVRHRWVIQELVDLRRHPDAPASSRPGSIRNLTASQVRDRFQPVLRDLEADLTGGKLSPHQAYATFGALGSMGVSARPAIPTIIAVRDAWDHDAFFRIPYYCSAVAALSHIDPTSETVIEVLANGLAGELPSRGRVCHRCGCLLEALERSGPAARAIAGPVLERVMAEPRFYTTYDHQLGRALRAIGIGSNLSIALQRVRRDDVGAGDRAETLRALAHAADRYSPADRTTLRETAAGLLSSDIVEIRAAAADALGATGPDAVAGLVRALGDWHFEVRVAAARGLGQIGPPAHSAAGALAAALDPYLGTALPAATALVSIGPAALAALDEERSKAVARQQPLVTAAAQAVREGRVDAFRTALVKLVPAGPHGQGFARIAVLQAGNGRRPYDPGRHRIRVRYTVRRYPGPGRSPESDRDHITADQVTSRALLALQGRKAGDRVELLLSPDIAQSPTYGTTRHADHWRTHVNGAPGLFEVTIERVCEPVVWTLFKGSGIWGPLRFELYCQD